MKNFKQVKASELKKGDLIVEFGYGIGVESICLDDPVNEGTDEKPKWKWQAQTTKIITGDEEKVVDNGRITDYLVTNYGYPTIYKEV